MTANRSAPVLVVLRALGLGDALTAVPALRALALAFGGHRRLLLGPPEPSALVGAPLGYEVVPVEGRVAVPEELPHQAFGCDVAVNLHGRGPQSHHALAALRPGHLIAFASEDHPGPRWHDDDHEAARWCRLLRESGIVVASDARRIPVPATPPPALARSATLLHPGAASAARRWPLERWAEVAVAERQAGRAVAITGSPAERHLAERLAVLAGISRDRVLAGRTTLRQLAAAVAVADRVACADTGMAHLASALGTPSVVLFGPTSPALWGPPRRPIHRVLWAGRSGDPHAGAVDDGLLEIPVAAVREALATVGRQGAESISRA